MVRKPTWVLLAVFIVLLGVALYLQKNPLPNPASATPSPTTPAKLFADWQEEAIHWIEYKTGPTQETPIELSNQGGGKWVLGKDGKITVEGGKVALIVAQIIDTRVAASLPADYSLGALGLQPPETILTIRDNQGKQSALKIGNETPTGSGYYVQVDSLAPMVVDSAVIKQLQSLLRLDYLEPPTPTPAGAVETLQPTNTP